MKWKLRSRDISHCRKGSIQGRWAITWKSLKTWTRRDHRIPCGALQGRMKDRKPLSSSFKTRIIRCQMLTAIARVIFQASLKAIVLRALPLSSDRLPSRGWPTMDLNLLSIRLTMGLLLKSEWSKTILNPFCPHPRPTLWISLRLPSSLSKICPNSQFINQCQCLMPQLRIRIRFQFRFLLWVLRARAGPKKI